MLSFTFTINEINEILRSLSAQPYSKVYEIISKITTAAQEQLEQSSPIDAAVNSD